MKVPFFLKFILCSFFSFYFSNHISAQWSPQNADTSVPITREGSVGVGLNNNPSAIFHVYQNEEFILPGGVASPTFRLEKRKVQQGEPLVYTWDLVPSDGLQFLRGYGGGTPALAMTIKEYGLFVNGTQLNLGSGGYNFNEKLTIGHSNTIDGNFIAFNGTTGDGLWQGQHGKAVIHSNVDGSLYFVTQTQGGYIPVGQNRRLTITPEGTSIIGDIEPRQTLSISSTGRSILRFNREGQHKDYELLGNQNGNFEFRGGVNGEGGDLPTLMRLKSSGKLVIGDETTPSPNSLGGTDISTYTLYVEGGILSKEVRVRATWSDYVFEKDYELLPLEDVETHIKEKGYLHNTPSGKIIETDGLELGSMMANQQEKIEEVYLHLIEMNKKLAKLEMENKVLKEKVKQLEQKD